MTSARGRNTGLSRERTSESGKLWHIIFTINDFINN